ncbi:RICIN domain-containing protein [Kitasatospora sp. NPDC101155]
MRGAGSGKCLDVPNASTTPGAQSQIYSCSGGDLDPVRPTAGSP